MLAYAGEQLPVRVGADGQPTQDGTVAVGPSTVLTSSSNGKWYYVEPEGKGAEQGFKDLGRIEQQMTALSLQPFLAQQTGSPTATGKAIDSSQANSEVQAWALMLKDALEQAFVIHAEWMDMGEDAGPAVHVNTDYGLSMGASEMADLIKLRAMGELSQKTLWLEAKRRAILSPTFDPEEEKEELMTEGPPPGMQGQFGPPMPGEGGFEMSDGTGGFGEPMMMPDGAESSSDRFVSDGAGIKVIRGGE